MKRSGVAVLVALLGMTSACDRKTEAPPPPEAKAAALPAAAPAPAPTRSGTRAGAPPLAPSVAEEIEAPEVTVRASGTTVHVVWSAPAGTGLNDEAPFKVRWSRSEGLEAPPEMKSTGAKVKDGFDVVVTPFAGAPRATLGGTIDLVVCDLATHKVCLPVKRKLDLGFIVSADAPAETKLTVNLPEAKPM